MNAVHQGIFEIKLPSGSPGGTPGLGHTLYSISACMCYAHYKALYPFVNDQQWSYGRWEDYFEPFWDVTKHNDILESLSIIRTVDVNNGGHDNFGLNFLLFAAAQKLHPEFIRKIYRPKKIKENSLQDMMFDLSLQIRLGDHPYQNKPEVVLKKIQELVMSLNCKNIFVMTDDYKVIELIKQKLEIDLYTLCPLFYNGAPSSIRGTDNLNLLFQEIDICRRSTYFLGSAFSQLSSIIGILRTGSNHYV